MTKLFKFIILLNLVLFATAVILLAQNTGTPNQLRVITDANGYLVAISAAQTLPLSNPTQFINTRLRTDSSNRLMVTAVGQAGTGTGTFKPGGLLCQNITPIVDALVQNQWNVASCSIPANTLVSNGDTLRVNATWRTAGNGNTKGFQLWYSLATATCSGTGANLCDSGCNMSNAQTTVGNGIGINHRNELIKNSTGVVVNNGFIVTGSVVPATGSLQFDCSVDMTAATKLTLGVRNESAAAASISDIENWSNINAFYFGAP